MRRPRGDREKNKSANFNLYMSTSRSRIITLSYVHARAICCICSAIYIYVYHTYRADHRGTIYSSSSPNFIFLGAAAAPPSPAGMALKCAPYRPCSFFFCSCDDVGRDEKERVRIL